jgi:hypothetical protein
LCEAGRVEADLEQRIQAYGTLEEDEVVSRIVPMEVVIKVDLGNYNGDACIAGGPLPSWVKAGIPDVQMASLCHSRGSLLTQHQTNRKNDGAYLFLESEW